MDGKIGMFVNSVDGYQGCIMREVQRAAAAIDLELDVFDAGHNAPGQAQDLVRFANRNPGKRLCAFFIPEADATREGDAESDPTFHLATRILDKGVGLIMLNHGREDVVMALRARYPKLPVTLVAIDNVAFGRMQGRQLRALVPKGGTVLCVRGNPFDTACRDRTSGLQQELPSVSDLTLEEIDARWDADLAEPGVHKWVTSPTRRQRPLHAVVSQNDHMGQAARQALLRAADELGRPELKQVPILGGDGLPEYGLRWVKEGILTATVCVTLPGKAAVEQLAGYWRDKSPLPALTKLPVRSYPELDTLRPISG
jgi:ABC-type sugar transport system substrate-binding protein